LALIAAVAGKTPALAEPASADREQPAVKTVREFAAALAAGNLERAGALLTPDSVLFMASATSVVPPPSLKPRPKPMFFDQELSEAEAQALRGVLDALALSGAAQVEPGQPRSTDTGVVVPVTITLKRDLLVVSKDGRSVIDLASRYSAAVAQIKAMTEEGKSESGERPAELRVAPSLAPGTEGCAAGTPGPPGAPPPAGGTSPAPWGAPPGPSADAGALLPPAPVSPEVEAARRATCLSNLRQLALAVIMFAQDYSQHLPNAAAWMDSLDPYLRSAKTLLHCPSDIGHEYSYALNSAVAGKSIGSFDDPVNTVLLFESNSGRKNASDPMTSLCDPPRHGNGNNFAFLDGHAKFVPKQ
jgi:prepilin-type processing-associated H-X9-DG protein